MATNNGLDIPLTGATGTGKFAGETSAVLVTPNVGTPSAGTLTSCTGLPISTGVSGLGTGVGTFLATPSSANLASAVTDESGTGSLVFATSPSLVTPALGTPSSGTLTSCTALPISTGVSGLGAGVGTFLSSPTSANLSAAVTDETGTGALVFANTPTLVTPVLGVATATSLNATTSLSVNSKNVVVSINRVVFTASGTYTAPAGLISAEVAVTGGGGGSGGTEITSGSQSAQSGGGGGGGYSSSLLTSATIGVSQTITIGSGGTGGTAGNNAGNAGSSSSFGALVIALAGQGGSGSAATGSAARVGSSAGAGGASGTGDNTRKGQDGSPGVKSSNAGEFQTSPGGGTVIATSNSVSSSSATTGIAGQTNCGTGASGLSTSTGSVALAGVDGGSGFISILEYLSD